MTLVNRRVLATVAACVLLAVFAVVAARGDASANPGGPQVVLAGPHSPSASAQADPKPDRRAQAIRTTARASGKRETRSYTVRKGDSLWSIGRHFGTTAEALASANRLRLNAALQPGMRLEVPARGQPGAKAAPKQQDAGLVATALKYRGVRYRYGGTTTRGMDCSGLVARVLDLHGIDAPHNSRALYRLGKPVSRGNLKPGDLVFFRTRGRGISHVGIYVGDGKFVHASSSKGRVRVDRLDEGYYCRRYVGARRVE